MRSLQLAWITATLSISAFLNLVQNAAAKFLKGQRKFDHVTPILKSLHWLPVHLRIELKILLYVFKSINNLAPSYLSDQLYPYNPTRNLRSGDQRLLSVPRSRLKHRGDRAFAVAGPRLWNSLPAYIRSAKSLTVFKSYLKTFFFSLAFNSLWVYGMNLWVVLCSMSLFVQHFGLPCLLFLNVLYK